MNNPIISMIAIISKNRGLGKDNKLLFHIPGELPRFKKITIGHPVIMGRKTFASIGKPLKGRLNIILSNNTSIQEAGIMRDQNTPCYFLPDLKRAIDYAKEWELKQNSNNSEIFIIGGGQIYEQALPLADRLYLTVVDQEADADTFFPDYSEFTKDIIKPDPHEDNGYKYTFQILEKETSHY